MLEAYIASRGGLRKAEAARTLPKELIWVDLLNPSAEERARVEKALKIEIPAREEMQEIEISSRLYSEGAANFMTAILLSQTETDKPVSGPVTFILARKALVTVRFSEPRSFLNFANRSQRPHCGVTSAEAVLVSLLEAVVDRTADLLERIANEVDTISHEVFERTDHRPTPGRDYQVILKRIGRRGNLNSKARESLGTLARLATYLGPLAKDRGFGKEWKSRIGTLQSDITSLSDISLFTANKVTFLLEAVLGMVNIEQNAIIKIFSVAAVVFLPPTLLASVWGMNFEFMPELDEPNAYLWAIAAMVVSAILPYLFFKRKGWL
ncbi:MAG TPA: magnesium transporter CorA family protein [Sphingomonadales bacterium]|nr:magnesium transporter CorA family protein [Sphingomonadales bacterium]